MATSIFTQLLDSYDGIRKRTWKPAFLVEGGYNQYKAYVTDATGKFHDLQGMLQAVSTPSQTFPDMAGAQSAAAAGKPGVYKAAPDPSNPGREGMAKVFFVDATGNPQQMNQDTAVKMIQFWMDVEQKDPGVTGTRAGDDPVGGAEGVGEVELTPEEEEEEKKAKQKETKELVHGGDQAEFLPYHKTEIIAFHMARGKTKEQAEKLVAKMEKQVNKPFMNSRLFKAFLRVMGKRPDLPAEVKQESLNAVGDMYLLANKVEEIDIEGERVKVIPPEALSDPCVAHAAAITTVRGERGQKRVFVGRGDTNRVEGCFDGLQDFTSEWDHNRYGAAFGGVLGDLGPMLFQVRVLPLDVERDTITLEEVEKYDHLVRASLSVERLRGKGGGELSNHYQGMLQECSIQYLGAQMIPPGVPGREANIARAKEEFVQMLSDGTTLQGVDLENLANVLTSDEFIQLEELQRLDDLGIGKREALKLLAVQSAFHAHQGLQMLGVADAITGVTRPSKSSKTGHKTDVAFILDPEKLHTMPPRWRDSVVTKLTKDPETGEEVETLTLEISIKTGGDMNDDTAQGTASLNVVYGGGDPSKGQDARDIDRTRINLLHTTITDDLLAHDSITPEQHQDMTDALEWDRQAWKDLEGPAGFGSFTQGNSQDMLGWIDIQLELVSVGEGGEPSLEQQHMQEIRDDLVAAMEDGTPASYKQAAQKVWHLKRLLRAQQEPSYGKASAMNDALYASQTFNPEVLLKGAPGFVQLDNNRQNFRQLASRVFSERGGVSYGISSSSLHSTDPKTGEKLTYQKNRVAAKTSGETGSDRKYIVETSQTLEGAHLTADRQVSRRGDDPSLSDLAMPQDEEDEDEEGMEEEDVSDENIEEASTPEESNWETEPKESSLSPLLRMLPSTEIGTVEKEDGIMVGVLRPYCLKVKIGDEEFEGGYDSKEKAIRALKLVKELAKEFNEKVSVEVKDYKWHRTFR